MKEIPLTQGYVALVDDSDFETVNAHNWYAEKASRGIYATRNIRKPSGNWGIQRLHRFLMPEVPRIDHHDGDGLNNQRDNLRPATHKQNTQSFRRKKIGATSSFRGVYWNKSHCKWYARIEVSGTPIYLGCFTSETDAAKAYDVAAVKHFGDFASPNFNRNHKSSTPQKHE